MNDTPLTRLAAEPEEVRKRKGTLHSPGEILKQPRLWRETAAMTAASAERGWKALGEPDFVIYSGAGSSLHAARLIEDAARSACSWAVSTASCTDILLDPTAFNPDGALLVVWLSRSGESPEVVEAATVLQQTHTNLLSQIALTCNPKGSLARVVEASGGWAFALPGETYDRALATTVSMTSMVVAGRFLAWPTNPEEYTRRIDAVGQAAETLLEKGAAVAQQAAHPSIERVAFLGSGPLEAAAQEGALKILELTDGGVTSMARSYLEFRHGPISFLDPNTTLVCLLSPDENTFRYEVDLIRQIREAKAARQIVVVGIGTPAVAEADLSVTVAGPPKTTPGESALVSVVFTQMLAFFHSLARGITPDRPCSRGLVNPVVQGVRIYPQRFISSGE